MMRLVHGTLLILIGLTVAQTSKATTVDPLFDDHSTLHVVLTAPFNTLIRERPDAEYLPGEIRFKGADGEWMDLPVEVRARGNFRHKYCDFPPMNLNFKRSQLVGTVFEGQNKLKLVAHCKDSAQYQQAVLREYLAYRILNSVTDLSFRVRLLEVIYVDSDERRSNLVRFGFLIEHPERLAERIGQERVDIARAEIGNIQPDELNLSSVFQFLIGNVDFSPVAGSNNECCHNYEMFGDAAGPLLAVPYDFDLAGMVNAPYAMTDKELGVEKIGQRVYRGWCGNNGYVEGSIGKFRSARDTVYGLIAGQDELEPTVRANVAGYIDEFYAMVDDPQVVEREITGKCTNDP